MTRSDLRRLSLDWEFWAHDAQVPPSSRWRTWVFLGGRGAGKTHAGAQWVKHLVRTRRARRIALIAPTLHDARAVMIEGASGLMSFALERPTLLPSRRRLEWANGAVAEYFSAEDPESLRGPQFDAAWGDELCFWAHPQETLDTLAYGLRLGAWPQLLLTTTPRPLPALKALLAAEDTVLTRAATFANERFLSPAFVAALKERVTGGARERQELFGEIVDDLEGPLWSHELLETLRIAEAPPLERIVVAVDPPAAFGPDADACGIVAAGAHGQGALRKAVVLRDASVQGLKPHEWAARVVSVAADVNAHVIIAESNMGGEMVRTVLQSAGAVAPIVLKNARFAKRARIEPVAQNYYRGLVAHLGLMPHLEEEMCTFGARGFRGSPDRLDALVWALTDLLSLNAEPGVRRL